MFEVDCLLQSFNNFGRCMLMPLIFILSWPGMPLRNRTLSLGDSTPRRSSLAISMRSVSGTACEPHRPRDGLPKSCRNLAVSPLCLAWLGVCGFSNLRHSPMLLQFLFTKRRSEKEIFFIGNISNQICSFILCINLQRFWAVCLWQPHITGPLCALASLCQ